MELFTACCRRGQLLLKDDEHKKIVLQSIIFLCRDQRIRLFGYVILEDEFHLLWEKQPDWQTKNIRQMMLKFTAQQIKHRLLRTRSPELEKYKSTLNDRHYHFWDKTTYFRQVSSLQMAEETIQHLHEAPVLSGLSPSPEMYAFSSARFYKESFHTPLSPIAATYIDVPESGKTYDLSVIGESDELGGTVDVPESGNTYDLTVIGESNRHSEGETTDVLESEKACDLTFIRESDKHSEGEIVNVSESEKTCGITSIGKSDRHSKGEPIDVPESEKAYDLAPIRKSGRHSKGEIINVPESGKTCALTFIGESDRHSKGETIDVPESVNTCDLLFIGESSRHSNGEAIDATDRPGYAMIGAQKSTAETYALETSYTPDYHKLRQLTVKEKHILPDQTDKTNDHSPVIGFIYGSLRIAMPGEATGPSIVSRSNREKESSSVITGFRMAFQVLRNDSG